MRGYFKFLSVFMFLSARAIGLEAETIGSAAKPSIELFVELNPMGSFIAKSEALTAQGAFVIKPGDFKADRIELKLDTLKTGITLRDNHMTKKYFETEKYPLAVMTNLVAQDGKFKADLNIHNQTKSVEGTYSVNGKTASVEFTCAISDFKISPARYMGVGVEDRVKVKVKVDVPTQVAPSEPAVAETPAQQPAALTVPENPMSNTPVEKPIELRNN